MNAAVAELGDDLAAVDLGSPESWRLLAVREFAYTDVAGGADSTGLVIDMMTRYPPEAAALADAYLAAYAYALRAARGEWPVV